MMMLMLKTVKVLPKEEGGKCQHGRNISHSNVANVDTPDDHHCGDFDDTMMTTTVEMCHTWTQLKKDP